MMAQNPSASRTKRDNILTNAVVIIEDHRQEETPLVWKTLHTRPSPRTGKSHRFYQTRHAGAFIRTSDKTIVEESQTNGVSGMILMMTSFQQVETKKGIARFVHLARVDNAAMVPIVALRLDDSEVLLADLVYQPA